MMTKKKNLYLLCTVHGVYCICKDKQHFTGRRSCLRMYKKIGDPEEKKKELDSISKYLLTVWL